MYDRYPYMYGRTIKHEHKHEHAMTGSVAVDPQRASAAFRAGLEALEALRVVFKDEIAHADEKIKEREREDWERYERKWRERDEARTRVAQLEKKSHWLWGLDAADSAELANAKQKAGEYMLSLTGRLTLALHRESSHSGLIRELERNLRRELALSSVAIDCSHLEPEWAAAIYFLETDATEWVRSKYPFNQYVKGE